ncbi:MAG TPA: FGGY family carbohydrate kinase, partial [Ktedonobacterales bacterium]|nr:FGGY family carbohydrate kinase [Ktedonobacterales bacterium]
MTDKHCTLGVDIGTTSAKAIAFAPDGTIVAQADAGVALLPGGAGVAEQDPVAVAAAVNHAIMQATHQAQQIDYQVDRVGVSAAMHSVILVGP